MKTALVTGANGFIGRKLVEELRCRQYDVSILTRSCGDISDPKILAEFPPASIVFHLAGCSGIVDSWSHTADFMRDNVIGTQNVISYCIRHKAKLVFASTYVYGQPAVLPISEACSVQPNNPYAMSKYLGENLCAFAAQYQDITVAVLRLFNVFGHGQRSEFLVPTIFSQIEKGEGIYLKDLRPKRDYVYIDDVVNAFVCAAQIGTGLGIFNIGYGRSYSVSELVAMAQHIAGTHLPVFSDGISRPQEILDIVSDCKLAYTAIGWKAQYSLQDGLSITWKKRLIV